MSENKKHYCHQCRKITTFCNTTWDEVCFECGFVKDDFSKELESGE